MKKYIIYQTDNWHTHNSKDLLAVCTTHKKAIQLIKKHAKTVYDEKISNDDIYMLTHHNQTQNFEGEWEYIIEELTQNELN